MGSIVLWFVKITGVIPFLIWFRPKKYFEGSRPKYTGQGEILIANHTTMMDFASMIYIYPLHVIRVLMAEVLYKKKLLAWFVTQLKGIRVNRYSPENTDRLSEAIETLESGGVVGVFPEGRLNPDGINYGPLLNFSPGAAYLALKTGAKVRPLYFNSKRGFFKRTSIMIGEAVDLQKMYGKSLDAQNIAEATRFLRQKTEKLREDLKFRNEYKERSLITGFTKWSMRLGMKIAFPYRLHQEAEDIDLKKNTGAVIVASNHTCIYDPPLLCTVFKKQNLHILAGEALYEYPMLAKLLRRLGCIKVDRNIMDVEAFHIMQSLLEKGESIGIFPEGRLSPDGELSEFKAGTLLAAYAFNVDIIPVYISNKAKMFRKKGRDIWIGKKIRFSGSMTPENIKKGSELLFDRINELKNKSMED